MEKENYRVLTSNPSDSLYSFAIYKEEIDEDNLLVHKNCSSFEEFELEISKYVVLF